MMFVVHRQVFSKLSRINGRWFYTLRLSWGRQLWQIVHLKARRYLLAS